MLGGVKEILGERANVKKILIFRICKGGWCLALCKKNVGGRGKCKKNFTNKA